jgi:AraC-like DNA-binding protein
LKHRIEESVEEFLGVVVAPALTLSASENAEIKTAHLVWNDVASGRPAQCDVADGYGVFLLRRDLPSHPAWIDGRSSPLPPLRMGQVLLMDQRAQHSALVHGDFDCLSIFTSSGAIRQFQDEHGLPSSGELSVDLRAIHDDEVMRHLGEALLPAIARPDAADQLYVSHVAHALLARLQERYGTLASRTSHPGGGLAAWQERRAKEMLLAHVDGQIGLEALAAECRLSRSHFARAFKVSTGLSPHRWLRNQRVAHAKTLLLETDLPLEQIAQACGFADSSHLTRVFARATSLPPGAWRRTLS